MAGLSLVVDIFKLGFITGRSSYISENSAKGESMLTESYVKATETVDDAGLKTVGDCLKFYANELNQKDAFVFASSDGNGEKEIVSWKELYEKSLTVAKALVKLG